MQTNSNCGTIGAGGARRGVCVWRRSLGARTLYFHAAAATPPGADRRRAAAAREAFRRGDAAAAATHTRWRRRSRARRRPPLLWHGQAPPRRPVRPRRKRWHASRGACGRRARQIFAEICGATCVGPERTKVAPRLPDVESVPGRPPCGAEPAEGPEWQWRWRCQWRTGAQGGERQQSASTPRRRKGRRGWRRPLPAATRAHVLHALRAHPRIPRAALPRCGDRRSAERLAGRGRPAAPCPAQATRLRRDDGDLSRARPYPAGDGARRRHRGRRSRDHREPERRRQHP